MTALLLPSQGTGTGGVPVGTVIAWPLYDLPAGTDNGRWLECNGQSVDAGKYPKLAAMMKHTPNYQGVFLRGYGSQYSYHYGTVLHSSAAIGELQGDAIRNITGSFGSEALTEGATGNHPATGAFYYANGHGNHIKSDIAVGNTQTFFESSRTVPTASENRPINKAVKYLIKAK